MKISMDDWQRGAQIRHISKEIIDHIQSNRNEDAIDDLVTFATLINARDMSSYAKLEDNKDIRAEIKSVEANLNARIDKVEANLRLIISESQINTIKWIAGMILAQSTGMAFLFLKLSGKF